MPRTTRLAAVLGVAATLTAAAVPAAANAAPDQACSPGFAAFDFSPFGPYGPYGADGPYGAGGPLHDQPNPMGDAAQCGGLFTFIVRGGTLDSFVQGNIASLKPR